MKKEEKVSKKLRVMNIQKDFHSHHSRQLHKVPFKMSFQFIKSISKVFNG